MSLLRPALLLALLLAPSAHAGRRDLKSDLVEDALAWAPQDREKAIRLLEEALEEAKGSEKPTVMLHLAEQHRLAGHSEEALTWFDKVGEENNEKIVAAATLGEALIAATTMLGADTVRPLHDGSDKEVLPTQNADRYALLAKYAAAQNDAPGVKDYTKRALSAARWDSGVRDRIEADLRALLDAGHTEEIEEGTPLESAEKAFAAGRLDDARRKAEAVIATAADSEDGLAAQYLIKRIDANMPVDGNKIGVILPLSGKYEAAGGQVKEAIQLAWKDAGSGRQLVFVDGGDTPESAVAAAEKLVLQDGVLAILGPLRTEDAEAVTKVGNALRVPIISLSQAAVDTKTRPWVVQGMVTQDELAEALVSHVFTHESMKAFAIFAPDNPYGHAAAVAFTAAVTRHGGTIQVEKFYDPEATDLIPFAKELGRKDYTGRAAELSKLRKEAKERGADPSRVVLPPILDFDGLFLPDNARRIPLACAGLAYEEFPMGDFATSKGGRTVPLLGLSTWNQSSLVTTGGPYVRGAIFVDAFFEQGEEAEKLGEHYRTALGRTPSALEANAYDAVRLVGHAASSPARDRAAFRDALLQAKVEGSATGSESIDPETRSVKHRIRVLTLDKDKVFPVDTTAP